MVSLRIQILGAFAALKDGQAVRLRTRHQALLLARLVIGPLGREELAELLWPDAPLENGLAYLRRARRELKVLGFDLVLRSGVLQLPIGVANDLEEAHRGGSLTRSIPVLEGFDDSLAQEIRSTVRRQAERTAASRKPRSGDDAYAAFGRLILQRESDFAATCLLRHGVAMKYRAQPQSLFDLYSDLLAALPADDSRRADFLVSLGWNAYLSTRHGLARRVIGDAVKLAEPAGNLSTAARALTILVAIEISESQWESAREVADRAITAGERSGDPNLHARALFNSACLRRHVLDVDRAVAEFRESLEIIEDLPRAPDSLRNYRANLAMLSSGHGAVVGELPSAPSVPAAEGGFSAYLEAATQFWIAFGGDLGSAIPAATRQLEVSSEDGMETSFVQALDDAACLFGRLRLGPEAAACIRLGSSLRRTLEARRSPGDRFLVRRHAPVPYFGPEVARLVRSWRSDDLPTMARRISKRLGELR